MAEHPTDKVDHQLSDEQEVVLSGEALRFIRTEAEIRGLEPGRVLACLIGWGKYLIEETAETGRTLAWKDLNGIYEGFELIMLAVPESKPA